MSEKLKERRSRKMKKGMSRAKIGMSKKFVLLVLLVVVVIISGEGVSASWWNEDWDYCMNVTVSSAIFEYAHEIILNTSNFGYSKSNREDIRIVNASCNNGGTLMKHWVKNWNTTGESEIWFKADSSGSNMIYAIYYNKTGASNIEDPENVFLYYFNFSGKTADGDISGQGGSDTYTVEDGGRTLHLEGNGWRYYSDWEISFTSGTSIIESDMNSSDSGEIIGYGIYTSAQLSGAQASYTYKFAGSQSWGLTPEQTYSGSGWMSISAELNDFSRSGDYLVIANDDDGDSSSDWRIRDLRIRNYTSPEPTFVFGSEEESIPPDINFTSDSILNGTTTANTSVEINVSIVESDLDEVIWNWNGTNYTLFDDSLILMMNFDNVSALGENDTYVVDLSRYGNNGSVNDGASWTSSGKYNGVFEFDGVNQDISVPNSASLQSLTEAITISAWIKSGSWDNAGNAPIIDKFYDGVDRSYFLWADTGGELRLGIGNNAGSALQLDQTTTNMDMNLNQWYYIVVTWDKVNGSGIFYRNGQQIAILGSGATESMSTNNALVYIGRDYGTESDNFNGSIDEVRIWNRSLSTSEIQQLYFMNLNKYDIDKWSLYVNQSKNATDGLTDGDYTYFASAKDGSGNENLTEERSVNITSAGDDEYPVFSNYDNDTVNGTEYVADFDWGFNVTIVSTNGTVGLEFNGTNYTVSNISANVFNVTVPDLGAGVFSYYWWAYGNGSGGNYNVSNTQSYTVVENSSLVLGLSGTESVNYGGASDFQGSGCPSQLSCELFRNQTLDTGWVNLGDTQDTTVLGADNYTYVYNTTGNANYSSVQSSWSYFMVNKTILEGNLTNVTGWSVVYGTAINVSWEETNVGDGDVFYNITRDGFDVTNEAGLNVTLAVGTYAYVLNASGGLNWTANASMDDYSLVVSQATGVVNGTINGTQTNYTVFNGTETTLNVYINATNITGDGTGKIYVNGTLYNAGIFPLFNVTNLSLGLYNVTFEYDGNGNFTGVNETWWVNVTIPDIIPPDVLIVYPANGSNSSDTGINVNYTVGSDANTCWFSNDTYSENVTLTCGNNITDVVWIEGQHNVTVWVNDSGDNVNKSIVVFTVDTAAPTFDNLANQTLGDNESLSFNIDATDTGVGIESFVINDTYAGLFAIDISTGVLTNSSSLINNVSIFYFNVSVNDTLNNVFSEIFFVNVTNSTLPDIIIPTINITYPINLTDSSNNTLDVNYVATDEIALSSCWFSNDTYSENVTLADCGTNITDVVWIEGQHNVTVWVNDSANNVNKSSVTFTIDTTATVISIISPSNYTNTTNTRINVNYTVGDGVNTCWYSNDTYSENVTLADCGTNITNVVWIEGNHNVTVWVNDSVNNVNKVDVVFTVDTTAPYFDEVPDDQTVSYGNAFSYDINATDSREFGNYGVNDTRFKIDDGGLLENNTVLGVREYYINITVNDTIGNLNSSVILVNVTQVSSVVYVYVEDLRSNGTAQNNTAIWLNASLQTGDSGAYIVLYKNGSLINNGTSAIANFTAFNGTGLYNITAVYETSQNYSSSYETWWVNVSVVDNTNPDVLIGKNESEVEYGLEVININWSVSDNFVVGVVIFNVTYPNGSLIYDSSSSSGDINLSSGNLTVIGNYSINLWANDSSGNENSTSDSFVVNDTVVPGVSVISPLNQTYAVSNMDFNISASENLSYCLVSIDDWGSNDSMSFNVSLTGANFTNGSVLDGSYVARFWCNDRFGNVNNTETVSFSVDTVNPVVNIVYPSDDVYLNFNESVNLNYTISSNDTDSCWYVLNGGANQTIASCLNMTFNLSERNHLIELRVNDSAGLEGSDSVNFTIDLTSPVVSLVAPANNSLNDSTNTIGFYYNVSDDSLISNCSLIINEGINSSVSAPVKAQINSMSVYLSNADYNWSVNCTDSALNFGGSEIRNLSVSYTAPVTPSTDGGGGGGGSVVVVTIEPECNVSEDCEEGYSCYEEECVKLFDIKILSMDSLVSVGESFNLNYFMKGMANIEGDVVVKFWIEDGSKKIELGQDVIYLGSFEEKTETIELYLPTDTEKGVYDFYVQVNFENYDAKSFRKVEIDSSGRLITGEGEVSSLGTSFEKGVDFLKGNAFYVMIGLAGLLVISIIVMVFLLSLNKIGEIWSSRKLMGKLGDFKKMKKEGQLNEKDYNIRKNLFESLGKSSFRSAVVIMASLGLVVLLNGGNGITGNVIGVNEVNWFVSFVFVLGVLGLLLFVNKKKLKKMIKGIIKKRYPKESLKGLMKKEVYTEEGNYVGKIEDVFLGENKIDSLKIKLGKKDRKKIRGIVIGYNHVNDVGDVVLIDERIFGHL